MQYHAIIIGLIAKLHRFMYHRRTAVRPVLMATSQSNGNGQILTPHRIQTP